MSEASFLPLPSPWALGPRLRASAHTAGRLAALVQAIDAPCADAVQRLRALEAAAPAAQTAEVPADTGTPLSRDEVLDFDRRFEVMRCADASADALLHGFAMALRCFMQLSIARPALHRHGAAQREGFRRHAALLARCAGLDAAALPAPPPLAAAAPIESPAEPLAAWALWQGLHWTFFIDVQGLVLSLLRFDAALDAGQDEAAALELDTAAALLCASGNAMQLATGFAPQVYHDEVRPAMMPPHVASDRFSGLMVWDHARLVRLWQQLRPRFAALPAAVRPAHAGFVQAYREMMDAHRGVCARFAGEHGGSLRSRTDSPAVQTLQRIGQMREGLLAPNPAEESQ